MRVHACVLLALGLAAAAPAADYPSRPIRLLVPFPPGGGSDTLARIIAPRLADALGQQVVVDNRTGAAGNIAAELVARASPDGHTAMLALNSLLTMNPLLYSKLPFNVETDLQPVTQLSFGQYLLLVHPGVRAATFAEFLDLARTKPASLAYASAGVGSPTHLAAELLKSRAKIDLVHVPYKGAGPAVLATLSGESQIVFASVAAGMPQVRAGRLRALAVTGLKRSAVAPELPTLNESGFAGYNVASWHALLLPARTPGPVLERLHRETLAVAKSAPVQEAMTREGMETTTGRPEQLAQLIRAETAMWRDVIRQAGIRPE